MAGSQVPKFGNWDSEGNVPYTTYFDNARKGRKGSKSSPSDPQDFPESEIVDKKGSSDRDPSREEAELRQSVDSALLSSAVGRKTAVDSSRQRHVGARSESSTSEPEGPKGSVTPRVRHERHPSQEEDELRRSNDSPLRHESAAQKTTSDSPHHRHGGLSASDTPRRVTRQSVGSDRSVEHSPLHPQSQARLGGKGGGVSSPSWERKVSSEGSHGLGSVTPGRSRLRSVTRGDEPDQSPAVPKFGDWDENDPAAAEGYSHIFNRVREEKQTGAEKVPVMPTEAPYSNGPKRDGYDTSKSCGCFSWCRR